MPLLKLPDHSKARICVLGDMMLDNYINASCERILLEARVKVVDIKAMLTVWVVRVNSNR